MNMENIFLFHGKGGSPEGSAKQLEEVLRQLLGAESPVAFHRPRLLHSDPNVPAEVSLADLKTREIPPNSVLIGISLGGLVAAKLQEDGREELPVLCISSPTWADGVRLERKPPHRVAIYSSNDEVIADRTADWSWLAQAIDLPWLTHDTDRHKEELGKLILAQLK